MDFKQNDNFQESQEQQISSSIPNISQSTRPEQLSRKGIGWKIFFGIVLALSIMANIALFLMLVGIITIFTAGQKRIFTEEVLREGPRRNKIVVVTIDGIIYDEQAQNVYQQLKAARKDKQVKGLIVRINSPGGTISASDQIYTEILKYRQEEGKPVIAFMQGMAASGGYYTSVACEKIVAEPTTITGSIGVILGHFVLQELFEDKLGILPVVLAEGEKKDWPSSFEVPTEEQLQYLRDRLLTPAYERFIDVIIEGRKNSLTPSEVRQLADGGILVARQALDKKLIDQIGYLDDAIELIKSLAKIDKAHVVEYRRVFSLANFLNYRTSNFLKFDRATLYELSTPQVLYLWNAY
jgi:protease-4